MSEITRYPRYRVIAGLEQKLHEMMTRPDGFVYEEAEVAIVRAAAEITGLTAEMCQQEADTGYVYDAHATAALRRYAKLAK